MTPVEFKAFIRPNRPRFAKLVETAKITPDN